MSYDPRRFAMILTEVKEFIEFLILYEKQHELVV